MGRGGYAIDIGYSAGFYPEISPSHLAFAQWCAGRTPPPPPRRMLELGCGQGFGLALLAAANPDVAYEGCDFNADHVAHARWLAETVGLTNLYVEQADFRALAARGGGRDVDVVAAHGVLSWISPATRKAALDIAGLRLRDGGTAMFSYNCLPGWAPLLPLRQLMVATRHASSAGSLEALAQATALLRSLRSGKAAIFDDNPDLCALADALPTLDPAYVAHEYFCEDARPLAFAEAAELASASGLSYAASATLSDNFAMLGPVEGALRALFPQGDADLRETLRDLMRNQRFRRDVFVRGPNDAPSGEAAPNFILSVPAAKIVADFPGAAESSAKNLFAPILTLLAQDEASIKTLSEVNQCVHATPEILREALALLVESGQVMPLLGPPAPDFGPAQRFNRMVVDCARRGLVFGHLASPVSRTGIRVDDFGLMALAALFDGEANDVQRAAKHGLAMVTRLGRRPAENGAPIEDDARAEDFLAARLAPYINDWFNVWRRLGAV